MTHEIQLMRWLTYLLNKALSTEQDWVRLCYVCINTTVNRGLSLDQKNESYFQDSGFYFASFYCKAVGTTRGKKRRVPHETTSAGESCKAGNALLGMAVIWFESPRDDATPDRSLFPTNFQTAKGKHQTAQGSEGWVVSIGLGSSPSLG